MLELLLFLSVVLNWASISLTEGWKWKHPDAKENLITYDTYHLWRALTGISFFITALIALKLPLDNHTSSILVLAFLAGWALYERLMSLVEHNRFMASRGSSWHLAFGFRVPRLPPILDVGIILICTGLMVIVL